MKRLVTALGLCAAVLVGGLAQAAEDSPTLARIVKKDRVRVGVSGEQPPFVMKDRDGNLIGFEVDLAKAIAGGMGAKLDLVVKPFAELLPALERGEVDMVMSGMTMTPERSMTFAFVGPYYVSGKTLLTKSPKLAQVVLPSAMNRDDLTFVALQNSTSQDFARESLPQAKLVTAPDYEAAVKMVIGGKAQAMIADLPACLVTMLRHPNKGLEMSAALLTMEPIGVALPSDDPRFESYVTNLLDAVESTGKLAEMTKYWFEGAAWLSSMP